MNEMMTTDDMELLRQYAADQSESAFAALVSRHAGLVYSAALRRVRDPQLAEEVTQAVFILLARKAGSLDSRTILPGWLYRTACFISGNALKQEHRRQQREQEAYMQSTLDEAGTDAAWKQMSPLLEEGMLRLGETDRDALVLRFFEGRNLMEVGAALGASEEAAKKRVNRAVEKLRAFFTRRGVSLPAAALTSAISANSVQAAPEMLARTVAAVALGKGAGGGMASLLATTAKGGASATGAGVIGALGAILCPLLAFLNLFGVWRLRHQEARSDRERRIYKIFFPILATSIIVAILLASLLMSRGDALIKTSPSLFVTLMIALMLGYPLLLIPLCLWFCRAIKQAALDLPAMEAIAKPQTPFWEYRSRFQLLGLPFIHFRAGGWQRGRPVRELKPVKAWIAADDGFAVGVLFAYGAVAVAPVSIGACAIGLFSYGAMAAGALAVGGYAFGIWAFGATAVGWQASAGCAIAWDIASGGQYAIAHHYAFAPVAHAAQVNNELVRHLVKSNSFLQACWNVLPWFFWLMWAWAIPLMTSMIAQWWTIARKPRPQLDKPTGKSA